MLSWIRRRHTKEHLNPGWLFAPVGTLVAAMVEVQAQFSLLTASGDGASGWPRVFGGRILLSLYWLGHGTICFTSLFNLRTKGCCFVRDHI